MPRRNLFASLVVGVVSLLCWQNSQGARPQDEMMELYGTFVDAVEQVQANYVKPVTRKDLLESALRGMLAELDPHSSYFNEGDWKRFEKEIDGNFVGIGIRVDYDRRTGRPIVVAPIVNSPAYAAGIVAGDQIVQVNGESTEDWTPDQIVEKLTGRPGSEVKLVVQHPGGDKTEELTVRREVIELDSVLGDRRKPDDTWDFLLDKESKVGYVRVGHFYQGTAEDLKKALDELTEQGMKGLILDLRDDPGGLLSAAVEVSDLFLDEGKIVTTRGRNTREKVYEAEKDGTFTDFPMVVLVNQHSASAAEIVSAALQDHGRAVIVGQRSFGKGSVQNILPLNDGDSKLKLTVATYWRPSGKNIHRFKDAKPTDEWGVTPDDVVRMSDEDYLAWYHARQERDLLSRANKPKDEAAVADPTSKDPQLAKALEVVKEKLKSKAEGESEPEKKPEEEPKTDEEKKHDPS
jgi:carboxyl-terminal processing protease